MLRGGGRERRARTGAGLFWPRLSRLPANRRGRLSRQHRRGAVRVPAPGGLFSSAAGLPGRWRCHPVGFGGVKRARSPLAGAPHAGAATRVSPTSPPFPIQRSLFSVSLPVRRPLRRLDRQAPVQRRRPAPHFLLPRHPSLLHGRALRSARGRRRRQPLNLSFHFTSRALPAARPLLRRRPPFPCRRGVRLGHPGQPGAGQAGRRAGAVEGDLAPGAAAARSTAPSPGALHLRPGAQPPGLAPRLLVGGTAGGNTARKGVRARGGEGV